jgi:hypothetical protein
MEIVDTSIPTNNCIYCGNKTTKERKGEHIIPEAIGGRLTLKETSGKSVCTSCNNGVLSVLDNELCRRSYLSVIASQEIDSSLWQLWDIDHSARQLLIEARPDWEEGELRSVYTYPQMIFERSGPQIRGNSNEMKRLSKDQVLHVMTRAIYRAFERFRAGKKRVIHFERVRTDLSRRGFRLPPRVYAMRSISEITKNINNQKFVFRFINGDDLRFAFRAISHLDWNNNKQFDRTDSYPGSQVPSISIFFDQGLTVRAMMKIGFNLLAAYCTNTMVNYDAFPEVTRLIRGNVHATPNHIEANGFVYAEDVEELAVPNCHSFRITTLDNHWIIYMSFFGGRIGGVVSFPGPNFEEWKTMKILAPIKSKNWTAVPSQVYQPLKARIEWSDQSAITPSLKLQYSHSRMVIEQVSMNNSRKR